MEAPQSTASTPGPAEWKPLGRIERRVIGVLVEKAKTTPEQYPLSLNALTAGCNQKSNRHPKMELDSSEVEDALERLREQGVVVEVHSDGRVSRFRHRTYEWLGVNKAQLAVIAELLLRGPQTVGELRGRAARMEPIAGLSELKPILEALEARGLVLSLTPPGRGQVVTHGLYTPQELPKLQAEYGNHVRTRSAGAASAGARPSSGGVESLPGTASGHEGIVVSSTAEALRPATAQASESAARNSAAEDAQSASGSAAGGPEIGQLRAEVRQLNQKLAEACDQIDQLSNRLDQGLSDLERIRAQLGD